MFCTKCGKDIPEDSTFCPFCGTSSDKGKTDNTFSPKPERVTTPKVKNYLVHAILATLFCCVPFGIVAIVYAAKVNGKLQAGDYEGAVESSKKAKLWCWVAFGSGIVVFVIAFLSGLLDSL